MGLGNVGFRIFEGEVVLILGLFIYYDMIKFLEVV